MQATNTSVNQKEKEYITCIVHYAITSPIRLRRFLRRWEKNDNDIDDIISAALLNALCCIHTFKGQSSIETWFYGVCKNTARQHIAIKMHNSNHIYQIEDIDNFDQSTEDHGALSLEDEVDRKHRLRKVVDAISRLPIDQQALFKSIYVDGVSYDALAQEMNVPLGTLKSRINRVRTTLLQKNALHM